MNRAKSARIATEKGTLANWKGFGGWDSKVCLVDSESRAIDRTLHGMSISQVKHRLRLLGKLDSSKPSPDRHIGVVSNVYDTQVNPGNWDRVPYYKKFLQEGHKAIRNNSTVLAK